MHYVTLHGLRSFFVTQCRESGLPDTEIAALIGDKSGPAIIARTYGDVRPEHLLKQAQRVRFLAGGKTGCRGVEARHPTKAANHPSLTVGL